MLIQTQKQLKIHENMNLRVLKLILPSVISADTPHAYGVDGLRMKRVQTFRVDQFQGSVIEIHEEIFTLERNEDLETILAVLPLQSKGNTKSLKCILYKE